MSYYGLNMSEKFEEWFENEFNPIKVNYYFDTIINKNDVKEGWISCKEEILKILTKKCLSKYYIYRNELIKEIEKL